MKRPAIVLALLVAPVTIWTAAAQSDPPADQVNHAEAPVAPQLPPPSDAPVVDMDEFCGSERNRQRYYPVNALQRRVEGDAVLDCAISEQGGLRTCQVVDEQPSNMGFGDASLAVACRVLLNSDAASTESSRIYERDGERRVRRTVRWRLND